MHFIGKIICEDAAFNIYCIHNTSVFKKLQLIPGHRHITDSCTCRPGNHSGNCGTPCRSFGGKIGFLNLQMSLFIGYLIVGVGYTAYGNRVSGIGINR